MDCLRAASVVRGALDSILLLLAFLLGVFIGVCGMGSVAFKQWGLRTLIPSPASPAPSPANPRLRDTCTPPSSELELHFGRLLRRC